MFIALKSKQKVNVENKEKVNADVEKHANVVVEQYVRIKMAYENKPVHNFFY